MNVAQLNPHENYGTVLHPLTIEQAFDRLIEELHTFYREPYAQWPTDEEIATLDAGTTDARIYALTVLNNKYRDGWHASARIASLRHDISQRMHGGYWTVEVAVPVPQN